jgi:hypothetical protein
MLHSVHPAVMAGLDPAIQTVSVGQALLRRASSQSVAAWMAGSSPAMTQMAIPIDSNSLYRAR